MASPEQCVTCTQPGHSSVPLPRGWVFWHLARGNLSDAEGVNSQKLRAGAGGGACSARLQRVSRSWPVVGSQCKQGSVA